MPLIATRFKNNARLQRAAENNPSMKAFELDKDAVKILQIALRDLNDLKVGKLLKSFNDGAPDGIYGEETVAAVKAFQGKFSELKKDGITGKNTLSKLDAIYAAPPKPAPPITPPPKVTSPKKSDIVDYLQSQKKVDLPKALIANAKHSLVVLAEVHHAERQKGQLIAELVSKGGSFSGKQIVFFTSESVFANQESDIDQYMTENNAQKKEKILSGMSGDGGGRAKNYAPAYDALADLKQPRGTVFAGGAQQSAIAKRHEAIFKAFIAGAERKKVSPKNSFGFYILGAAHAGRANTLAALKGSNTVTQRLEATQWKTHVVRIIVNWPFHEPDTDTLIASDGTGDTFDMKSLLAHVAGKKAAYFNLRNEHSPFGKLKFAHKGRSKKPYNQLYDAFLYLPE